MDYDSLTPENKAEYDLLEKAIFVEDRLKPGKLNNLAHILNINEWKAIMYHSHMLKRYNNYIDPVPPIRFCPTCKKQKTEGPQNGCRDYFHII